MSLSSDDLKAIKSLFDEQDAKLSSRFDEQDAKFSSRFDEQDAKLSSRFDEQDDKFTKEMRQLRTELVEKIDDLALMTGQGFNEVHEKIDAIHQHVSILEDKVEELQLTVGRIENVQRAEITRVDKLERDNKIIKQSLRIA